MPWVRLDEGFPRHPKIAAAGPLGMALQVAALCYCNEYLTDGFIPTGVARTLLDLDGIAMHMWQGEMIGGGQDATADLVIQDVVQAGLWKKVKNGWKIHDYHDYQPTKTQVLEMRKQRAEAGKRGGQAKAALANGLANAKQTASDLPSKRSSKPLAKSYPVPVPVVTTPSFLPTSTTDGKEGGTENGKDQTPFDLGGILKEIPA